MKHMVLEHRKAMLPQCEVLTYRSSNFGDTAETVVGIAAEEIGKLGLPIPGASLHCFQKMSTLDSSP